MRVALFSLLLSSPPYPSSELPTSNLLVYETDGMPPGDQVTLETLGGGLARHTPQLYKLPRFSAAHFDGRGRYVRAKGPPRSSYDLWLSELTQYFGVAARRAPAVAALLQAFKENITGVVPFTAGAPNAALTWIAGQRRGELAVAASEPSTLALLRGWGVPVVWDARGKGELQAYNARGAAAFSAGVASFQLQSQFGNLAEYAVFARAPTVEYKCTGAKDVAACLKLFPAGGPAVQAVVAGMRAAGPGPRMALGWGPESAYVATLGAHGIYVHASDDAHDVAPVANAAVHGGARPRWPPLTAARRPVPSPPAKGRHRVAFLMTDGDNIQ